MNTHYLVMFAGFILAQLLMASIMVYDYQKEKGIPYDVALKTYLKAEIGFFVIGVLGILVVLFILSDFVNLSVTKEDLRSKSSLNWKENLQLYFKSCSVFVGGFVQYIAFKAKKKGKEAIDKAVDKLGNG